MLVTMAQFAEFVRSEAYFRTELWDWQAPPRQYAGGDEILRRIRFRWIARHSPVTHVSWYEADAYCRWRGGDLPSFRMSVERRERERTHWGGDIAEWCRNWYNSGNDDDGVRAELPARRRVAGWSPACAHPIHMDEHLGFRLVTR